MACVSWVLVFFGEYHFVGDLAFLPSLRQNLIFRTLFSALYTVILSQMAFVVKEEWVSFDC